MTKWSRSDINRLKNQRGKGSGRVFVQPDLPFDGVPMKKPRKEKSVEEFKVQIASVQLFDILYPELKALFFHIVNQAVVNDARIGQLLKDMGKRAGVWDMKLQVPRGGWWGIWFEFKSERGSLSSEQENFRQRSIEEGCNYKWVEIKSTQDFGYELEQYLDPSKRTDYRFKKVP